MSNSAFLKYKAAGGAFSQGEYETMRELLAKEPESRRHGRDPLQVQARGMLERSGAICLDEISESPESVVGAYALLRNDWNLPWKIVCDQRLLLEVLLFFSLFGCARLHKEKHGLVLS
jgi:hypothetical protein